MYSAIVLYASNHRSNSEIQLGFLHSNNLHILRGVGLARLVVGEVEGVGTCHGGGEGELLKGHNVTILLVVGGDGIGCKGEAVEGGRPYAQSAQLFLYAKRGRCHLEVEHQRQRVDNGCNERACHDRRVKADPFGQNGQHRTDDLGEDHRQHQRDTDDHSDQYL